MRDDNKKEKDGLISWFDVWMAFQAHMSAQPQVIISMLMRDWERGEEGFKL